MLFERVHTIILRCSLLHRGLLQSCLGKKAPAARGGWEEGKSARGERHRPPRSRFLSPVLPLPFLSLVFTNRSLCGGERLRCVTVISPGHRQFCLYDFLQRDWSRQNRNKHIWSRRTGTIFIFLAASCLAAILYYFGEGEQCKSSNKLHQTYHLFVFTSQLTFDIWSSFRNLLTYAFHFQSHSARFTQLFYSPSISRIECAGFRHLADLLLSIHTDEVTSKSNFTMFKFISTLILWGTI